MKMFLADGHGIPLQGCASFEVGIDFFETAHTV